MSTPPTLLIVEDDLRLRSLLKRRFEAEGVEVLTAAGMVDARGILKAVKPAAVVVDIGLEDSNGLELVAELAAEMLVLVMTGDRRLDLLRRALSLGAADVVFKPFEDRELAARVLARLKGGGPGRARRAVDCLERVGGRQLWCEREQRGQRLSGREAQALDLLLAHAGSAVDRDALSRAVYETPWNPGSRRVDALIGRLREKLHCDRCGVHRSLTTVHNHGYRLDHRIPDRD